MRKRAVSLALCLCMVLSLLPLPVLATGKHPFTDVAETVWFNDSVAYVYEHNLMKGTSDTTFEPYRATQRGMIVTILHRLEGTPTVPPENPFADVPKGSNYENAIIWAANNGIVNGYDNATFGPYENITRQQMAAILYRYAQMKGYRTSTSANLSEYADSPQIGDYARTAMAWANGEGLINGNSSKQLMPTGTATRAQVAAILTRFCQNVIPQQTPPVSPPIEEPPQTTPAPVDPINYTVTFDLNYDDAGVYQTLSVSEGEKVTKPKNPTREKYSFLDWYTTATTGGQKFNFKSAINSDITLYARWSRKSNSSGSSSSYPSVSTTTYIVTFNSNGGSEVSNQVVRSGDTVKLPSNPTRIDGYTFAGWYIDAGLTSPFDFNSVVSNNITLYAKWDGIDEYTMDTTDADEDGVEAWLEDLYGTSNDLDDTDGDGLSDEVEIYQSRTNPTLIDSDEDGVSDANEDADDDGLTNLREVQLGTSINKPDTDLDGLSDSEEVTLGTNPLEADTDGDGIFDGDEILLGLDPLKTMTDGVTHDGERVFTQAVSQDRIEESLFIEDNKAIPSLSATVSGNINRDVEIQKTTSVQFNDSRAIIGEAIDISGRNLDNGTLSFQLSDGVTPYSVDGITEEFSTQIICKFNDDSTTTYLDTDFDTDTQTISASIKEPGTYFVIDVQALFDELGLAMPTVANLYSLQDDSATLQSSFDEISNNDEDANFSDMVISNRRDAENSLETQDANAGMNNFNPWANATGDSYSQNIEVASADAEKAIMLAASGNAMAQADIVFIIDTTSSMRDEVNNVKNNIGHFVDALNERGVSAGFALVEYRDIDADGYDTTVIHKNGSSNWFYNMDSYKNAISNLRIAGGGDIPESVVDALETARLLDMRSSAGKIFVLVTDAGFKVNNRYGIPSMASEIQLLKNAGVTCSVVTSENFKNTYNDLYTETGGIFADINGDFHTELMSIADKIGTQIVGDGYWIYLQGPVPVPVRLKSIPTEGSDIDTDEDGKADIEELESVIPTGEVDLDSIIHIMSKGAITGTDYGKVNTYKYKSNPVEKDTDYDGIPDEDDAEPLSNNFKGILYYDEGKKTIDVEFVVDYSQLFGNNATYSKDLSILSSLYAADVYQNTYVKVTEGTTGGSDNSTEFGSLFGLKDTEAIEVLAEKQSDENIYDEDDRTEFFVGHRTVEFNGQSREIIILSVRGTNSTNEEWSSNFDMGADTEEYYSLTGPHPEWIHKERHKGFDVAANRLIKKFTDYLERHNLKDTALQKTLLITGHSRGAGIANILGAHFEDSSDFITFTYTFASPFTTTDSNADRYKTVFNIMNTDDIITQMPLESWGFYKYGIMKKASVAEWYEDHSPFGNRVGTFEWLVGRDYDNDGGTERTLSSFRKVADGSDAREALYVFDTSDDGKVNIGNQFHTTQKGAEDRMTEVNEKLKTAKLDKFTRLSIQGSMIKHVEVNYCPAYLLQNLANMASGKNNPGPMTGYDTKGKYASAKASFIVTSGFIPVIGGLVGGMADPHMQPTYYLLAYNSRFK